MRKIDLIVVVVLLLSIERPVLHADLSDFFTGPQKSPRDSKTTEVSRMVLEGRVIDPNGKPVEGIEVTRSFFYVQGYYSKGMKIIQKDVKELSRTKLTDSKGRFVFRSYAPKDCIDKIYVVCKDQKNNLIGCSCGFPNDTNMEIKLKPGIRIIGYLYDQHNNPVNDVKVSLSSCHKTICGSYGITHDDITGDDGQFSFSAVPAEPQDFSLNISSTQIKSYSKIIDRNLLHEGMIKLEPIQVQKAEIVIKGKVVDASENPVSDARIKVEKSPTMERAVTFGRTDDMGRFEVFAFELPVKITVNKYYPKIGERIRTVEVTEKEIVICLSQTDQEKNETKDTQPTPTRIPKQYLPVVKPTSDVMIKSVDLQEDVILDGLVLDSSNRPVANAHVKLMQLPFGGQPDKFPLETYSDEKGRFQFERPDTDQWKRHTAAVFLIAQKEGLALGWKRLGAPQDTLLYLSKPDQFSGKVVDQKGNPVSDAQVEIVALRVGEKVLRNNKAPDILTVSTDRQGRFSFNNLPVSGELVLGVFKEGLVPYYTSQPENPRKGRYAYKVGTTNESIVLEQGSSISGIVRDKETGENLPDIKLSLSCIEPKVSYKNIRHCITDQDGRFNFTGLASANLYRLSFLLYYMDKQMPYNYTYLDIKGDALNLNDQWILELSPAKGVLEVHVVEEGTQIPIEHAGLVILSEWGKRNSYTGEDGRIFMYLPAGKYRIVSVSSERYFADHRSHSDRTYDFEIKGNETVKLNYSLTSQIKIEGRVIGLDSKAVEGIEVCPFFGGMSQSRMPGFNATSGINYTDADGRFDIWINAKVDDIRHLSVLCSDQKRNLVGFSDITMRDKHPTISLERGIKVVGLLKDQNGNAVMDVGVSISFSAQRDIGSVNSTYKVRTLQDGKFMISAIPSDSTRLNFSVYSSWYQRLLEGKIDPAQVHEGLIQLAPITIKIPVIKENDK